jgi:hypothetical protein
MSPGELSNSDSNHGWSSSHHSLGSYGGGQGHRGGGGGGGELPISDNNVTTTNGALDAAEWDLEAESDIDVSTWEKFSASWDKFSQLFVDPASFRSGSDHQK